MKAVLISADLHPPRSHNIADLIDRLPLQHPLRPRLWPLDRLTPYVAAFRYPSADSLTETAPPEPTIGDIAGWMKDIEQIKAAVVAYLQLGHRE